MGRRENKYYSVGDLVGISFGSDFMIALRVEFWDRQLFSHCSFALCWAVERILVGSLGGEG